MVQWSADTNTNKTSAITGATRSFATIYNSTQDGTDQVNSTQVADGDYIVRIEMTSKSYRTSRQPHLIYTKSGTVVKNMRNCKSLTMRT